MYVNASRDSIVMEVVDRQTMRLNGCFPKNTPVYTCIAVQYLELDRAIYSFGIGLFNSWHANTTLWGNVLFRMGMAGMCHHVIRTQLLSHLICGINICTMIEKCDDIIQVAIPCCIS